MAGDPVLIAASHGTHSPAGRAAVDELRRALAASRPGLEIVEAYVDEQVQRPGLSEVLDGKRPAVVVPVLLSAGYHVRHDIARVASGVPSARVARPLGPDQVLVDVLADRLAGSAECDVVLAAAGSSDRRAGTDVRWTAARLGERLGRDVRAAFVTADVPRVDEAVQELARQGRRVALASYVLAPGHFYGRLLDVPADIHTPPLLPDARIADLVLRRYDEITVE